MSQSERHARLDTLMREMPLTWRKRWCQPGKFGCGCLGCANISGGLERHGFKKEEHAKWVKENESK